MTGKVMPEIKETNNQYLEEEEYSDNWPQKTKLIDVKLIYECFSI